MHTQTHTIELAEKKAFIFVRFLLSLHLVGFAVLGDINNQIKATQWQDTKKTKQESNL